MKRTALTVLAIATAAAATLALSACSGSSNEKFLGTWGTANVTGETWLIFEADGSFNGSDGCNGVFGEYEVSGDSVEFIDMGSTMMFCEGVDTWLSTAAGARLDADTLIVHDVDKNEIGTLDRAA